MRSTAKHSATAFALALAAVAAGACSSLTDAGAEHTITADGIQARIGSGIVFLTMNFTPSESMAALFEGPVIVDQNGCLRLDDVDRHTVVWPHGYGFEEERGTVRILDGGGALVGRAGETFSLPGGEVTSLHDGLGFTRADRDLAAEHCPGRYWIVSPS